METRHYDTDVAIIGGGPAGSATAIVCASNGLRVSVFERDVFKEERPGETLHPGIEPVLKQLGIDDARLDAVVGARHEGIWIDWNGNRHFQAFGSDEHGPWRGFQVRRTAFDAMLLDRAVEAGAIVSQPTAVSGLLMEEDIVCGVMTATGPVTARMVVDASGRLQWLGKRLNITKTIRSPQLIARYGYATGEYPERDAIPEIRGDKSGWQWIAKVWSGTYQWTRVSLDDNKIAANWMPHELQHLMPHGASRGADVTWRIAQEVARRDWFMVGDAAAVLDPTSSRGVLKALLSGMTAAHLINGALNNLGTAAEAAKVYHDWLAGWFNNDAAQLAGYYQELGIDGFN